MIIIPQPPQPRGTAEERIAAIERYISQLYDELTISLNRINYTEFDEETRKMVKGD